jgi:uncharacterized protein YjbI with pentapeptide repeats
MAHLTNLNFSGLDLSGLDFSRMKIASNDFQQHFAEESQVQQKNFS